MRPKNLEQWTLLYFLLPWPFFFLGFFQWPWAIQFLILLGFLVKKLWHYYEHYQSPFKLPSLSRRMWIGLVLLLAGWVILSGADGYLFHQNGDYEKHNAMLRSLVELSWPIAYQWPPHIVNPYSIQGTAYLIYYFAIYLPAAGLGKILGLAAARVLFAVEIWVGVCLAFVWFLRFCEKFKWWIPLLFIFASGMDILGKILMNAQDLMDGVGHLEWWAQYVFWSYQSQTTQLFWVPQHGIAGWILASVLLDMFWPRPQGGQAMRPRPCTWLLLMTIWSPFAVLGGLPLVALVLGKQFWPQWGQTKDWWKHPAWRQLAWSDIGWSLVALIPVLVFLSADMSIKPNMPFWKAHRVFEYWPKYLAFCFCEFGFFAYFMMPLVKQHLPRIYYRLMVLIVVMLALFPWYYFGAYNDFTMRASIPWLFLLWMIMAKVFLLPHDAAIFWPRRHLVLLLLIGAITPLSEFSRAIRDRGAHMPYMSVLNIRLRVAVQYIGYEKSLYGRIFAKRAIAETKLNDSVINYIEKEHLPLKIRD